MFDIITKREYWAWDDAGLVDRKRLDLKGVQDPYVLSRLRDLRGKRILGVGGGNSRVLAALSQEDLGNECWNAERFEGVGGGPKHRTNTNRIRIAECFLGEFDRELPDGYFDYLISVSVVEQVPSDQLERFFADSCRVLRPGGEMIHAIDLYVYDPDADVALRPQHRDRLRRYLSFGDRPDLGLRFLNQPAIDEDVRFRSHYATNTDVAMNQWNRSVPALRPLREIAQSVSIKAEWRKDLG